MYLAAANLKCCQIDSLKKKKKKEKKSPDGLQFFFFLKKKNSSLDGLLYDDFSGETELNGAIEILVVNHWVKPAPYVCAN